MGLNLSKDCVKCKKCNEHFRARCGKKIEVEK